MGLAIVRSIVNSHGGRVWAASAPAGGTIVCVSLPAEGAAL
jgi:signal transduction histidine kinase